MSPSLAATQMFFPADEALTMVRAWDMVLRKIEEESIVEDVVVGIWSKIIAGSETQARPTHDDQRAPRRVQRNLQVHLLSALLCSHYYIGCLATCAPCASLSCLCSSHSAHSAMSPSSSLVEQIRSSTRTPNPAELQGTLRAQLDEDFPDLSSLVDHVSQAGVAGVAGPSSAPIRDRMKEGKKKRKRGLKEEIAFWEASEAEAAKEVGDYTRFNRVWSLWEGVCGLRLIITL
jgi:hypothetical protein